MGLLADWTRAEISGEFKVFEHFTLKSTRCNVQEFWANLSRCLFLKVYFLQSFEQVELIFIGHDVVQHEAGDAECCDDPRLPLDEDRSLPRRQVDRPGYSELGHSRSFATSGKFE